MQGNEKINSDTIVLGGGCFWCVEAALAMIRGVTQVTPGYAGGRTEDPKYEDVLTDKTGHAEVVKVEYVPEEITLHGILTVFFGAHDPTTLNRQGNDIGTKYRSIILYTTDEQKKIIDGFISDLKKAGAFKKEIVTEVKKLERFYPAEKEHLDYYANNPGNPYCEIMITPKLTELRKKYVGLMREQFTEAPFTGSLLNEKREGMYKCSVCGNPLFKSDAKFESGSGWPSFDEALPGSVSFREDESHEMDRTEIVCSKCGAHLGHVFSDGPKETTGKRYCTNSVCLKFEKK